MYMKKSGPMKKGLPPTQATLGKPSFHTFLYKTWRIVYIRNKKLKKKKGDPPSPPRKANFPP